MRLSRVVSRADRRGDSVAYECARLQQQLIGAISWEMKEQDITRQQLAENMGVSAGRVSQILSGNENLTLKTLAALATALGAHFDVSMWRDKSGSSTSLDGTSSPNEPARA